MQVQMLMTPPAASFPTSAAAASGYPLSATTLSASPPPPTVPKLPGPIAVLTSVVRETGLRGLWLGHTGTLIRETGGGAAWFAAKEIGRAHV